MTLLLHEDWQSLSFVPGGWSPTLQTGHDSFASARVQSAVPPYAYLNEAFITRAIPSSGNGVWSIRFKLQLATYTDYKTHTASIVAANLSTVSNAAGAAIASVALNGFGGIDLTSSAGMLFPGFTDIGTMAGSAHLVEIVLTPASGTVELLYDGTVVGAAGGATVFATSPTTLLLGHLATSIIGSGLQYSAIGATDIADVQQGRTCYGFLAAPLKFGAQSLTHIIRSKLVSAHLALSPRLATARRFQRTITVHLQLSHSLATLKARIFSYNLTTTTSVTRQQQLTRVFSYPIGTAVSTGRAQLLRRALSVHLRLQPIVLPSRLAFKTILVHLNLHGTAAVGKSRRVQMSARLLLGVTVSPARRLTRTISAGLALAGRTGRGRFLNLLDQVSVRDALPTSGQGASVRRTLRVQSIFRFLRSKRPPAS